MQVWRGGEPIFLLPWHPYLARIAYGATFSVGLVGGYELWRVGATIHVVLLLGLFILMAYFSSIILRNGYAQLTGEGLSYWGFGPRKQNVTDSDKLQELPNAFTDPKYRDVFASHIRDLKSRKTSICSLPSYVPRHDLSFGRLRPWRSDEYGDYRSLFADPQITRWHEITPPNLDESLARVVYASTYQPYRSQWSYVLETHENEIAGHFEIRLISARNRSVEVSFGLQTAFRRRGFMSACLHRVIGEWAEYYGIRVFYARVRWDNEASQNLLESCGFERCIDRPLGLHSPRSNGPVQYYQRVVVP